MKNEGNMPYYFLCNCQSNNRNILAKFYENIENIPNLSQEIHKNTENVPSTPPSPPPPPPEKAQNIPKEREIPPIRCFSLTSIKVLSRIYVQNFLRSQTTLKK